MVNVWKKNGADNATAAHPIQAAPISPVSVCAVRQATIPVSAPSSARKTTTAG